MRSLLTTFFSIAKRRGRCENCFLPCLVCVGCFPHRLGRPFWVGMVIGNAKSTEQCGKRPPYACFGQFGMLETTLLLMIGAVHAKAESIFCFFTLVGDQTVYKSWSYGVNRFH